MPRHYDTDEDKRERILRAAWQRIRQYGYAKTTVAEIAADAGIAKGTAYLYFRSKSDIMLALVEETNRRVLEELVTIQRGDGPVLERLREVMVHRVRAIAELVRRHPHGEEFVRSFKPEIVKRVESFVRTQGMLAAALIHEGNEEGTLSVEDPAATGLLLAELFERFTPPYDHATTAEEVVDFAQRTFDLLLNGMVARPDGGSGARTRGETP